MRQVEEPVVIYLGVQLLGVIFDSFIELRAVDHMGVVSKTWNGNIDPWNYLKVSIRSHCYVRW